MAPFYLVNKSMQTTRRFDALKVWMSFRLRGRKGWSSLISASIENAAFLYEELKKDANFDAVIRPEISSLVFRVLPGEGSKESADDINKRIRRTLLHKYGVVIGQTVCRGKVYLKFTLLNPLHTRESLQNLMKLILSLQ